MRFGRQYWQNVVSQLKKFTTPRSRELERELNEVRRDYRELGLRASTLASEGSTARKTLESAKQQIDSIHDQLANVYQERGQLVDELRQQLQSLETEIKDLQTHYRTLAEGVAERDRRIEALDVTFEAPLSSLQAELETLQVRHNAVETQQAGHDRQLETLETEVETRRVREQELLAGINTLERRTDDCERNLRGAGDETRTLVVELGEISAELEAVNNSCRKQLADLALQLGDIEAERTSTRDRLQALQNSMTDAASQHSDTQRYLKALQGELDGVRKQQQSQLNKVEEKLTRLQIEQESLINTQSGLTDSLRKNRRWTTAAIGIAFLMAVLAGVTTIREHRRPVPELATEIDNTQPSPARQLVRHEEPAMEEPPAQSGEAVESAAFETETLSTGSAEPSAGPDTQKNDVEPPVGGSPANQFISAEVEPVSDTTSPAGGVAIGDTDSTLGEPPNSSPVPQIDIPTPATGSETNTFSKPLLTPEQATAAQSFPTQAFFEENAQKEGVVSLPSGLQYRVLRNGHGKSPGDRDMVILHYRGSLPDGREFGSSYADTAPVAYRVDQVIAGWREALKRMQEGAHWELYIPPELAHRSDSNETPGFLPLIYQLELITVSTATSP